MIQPGVFVLLVNHQDLYSKGIEFFGYEVGHVSSVKFESPYIGVDLEGFRIIETEIADPSLSLTEYSLMAAFLIVSEMASVCGTNLLS